MSAAKRIQASIGRASFIRKMFEEGNELKVRFGAENVFDFSIGNPNLEPPERFNHVLRELIDDPRPGLHGYMSNAGFLETRQAVAEYLTHDNLQTFSPEDIVMTVGAGGALNVILKTLLNPGEEVIIPKPYFMEYNFYLDNHQGLPRPVDTRSDFSLDFKAIGAAINEKTRAVLINSPNNPTGKVYTEGELRELSSLLKNGSARFGQPIYLISDEPYRKICYNGLSVPSVFNAYQETIMATSFSKDLSLPGERIGYAAANPEISDKEVILAGMVLCNRVLGYVNAPALMQRAVARLLQESVDTSLYQRKRDLLCDGLAACGYEFTRPSGAFYLFARTPIEDDVAFVAALLAENILVVPGSGFGGPGHMRIAYCVEDRTIEKALPGFKRVFDKFKKSTSVP